MDANDLDLIVLLNNQRDRDIERNEHWYRVPARRAPEQITHAHYIAFYLTKIFGDEGWAIREYAPVQGRELVRRRDLFPEESVHSRADEAYYKFELEPVIQLSRPIASRRGRRVLFIWRRGDKIS
jgi:hypothetical protein